MPDKISKTKMPHFFTATLAEAANLNAARPHNIQTIPQLLDVLARDHPNAPGIGMGVPGAPDKEEAEWDSVIYTYHELADATNAAAHHLTKILPRNILPDSATKVAPTIALLSDSTLDLLLCLLGLIRAGFAVLLLAPQCDSTAISHLLHTTGARALLYSAHLTATALNIPNALPTLPLPPFSLGKIAARGTYPIPGFINSDSTGYIHHTSGTASGLPKPVPQPHAAATVQLPSIPTVPRVATLTTTPLYHGGVADLMRSMMSHSMIWFFPPSVPVTAANVVRAVRAGDAALGKEGVRVRLFTGVPYVQKVCAEDAECVEVLKGMDMVGVGGARLEEVVGDFLVERGVRLVSRFGSSECGFLMTSDRDFESDKDWDWLRMPEGAAGLVMEERGPKICELVVGTGWPHMAKTNRLDGSYATSDLFVQNPRKPGAYKYLTRSDATIVLTNGKKLDPMLFEDALRAMDGVKEAIVFGQNKEFPGVLIFSDLDLDLEALCEKVEELNLEAPPFARIKDEMIIIIADGRDWPKSSKGTVLRNAAEEVFALEIRNAYANFDSAGTGKKMPASDLRNVQNVVRDVIEDIFGVPLPDEEDFFTAGLDSIMATEVRRKLLQKLDVLKPPSSNVVFEQRNIKRLARFLSSMAPPVVLPIAETMFEMAHRFSPEKPMLKPRVILITGATGALGSHILSYLFNLPPQTPPLTQIICLLRGNNPSTRLAAALQARHLKKPCPLDPPGPPDSLTPTLQVTTAQLHDPKLGLRHAVYRDLLDCVTDIIHCAWPVNFLAPLESFSHALLGLKNLLTLAQGCGAHFLYASSIASVLAAPHNGVIREMPSMRPEDATPLGYSRSKWVAERIVLQHGGDVLRIGQLSGNRGDGVWNEDEAWPQMVRHSVEMGAMPMLSHGEMVAWLPVDVAAEAVASIALERCLRGERLGKVWHVVNVRKVEWSVVLEALSSWSNGGVKGVETEEWLEMLRKRNGVKLLDLWENAYGAGPDGEENKNEPDPRIDVTNTAQVMDGFEKGYEITEPYLHKVFDHWATTGFLPSPAPVAA